MASFKDFVRFMKVNCPNIQCHECPLFCHETHLCSDFMKSHPDEAEAVIDKWCKEHPVKTRQSEILKLFPNTPRNNNEIIDLCPKRFYPDIKCIDRCSECKEKFWNKEIE